MNKGGKREGIIELVNHEFKIIVEFTDANEEEVPILSFCLGKSDLWFVLKCGILSALSAHALRSFTGVAITLENESESIGNAVNLVYALI
jgi:hypothetical protein